MTTPRSFLRLLALLAFTATLAACAGNQPTRVVGSSPDEAPRVERVTTTDLAALTADQFAALPPLEEGIQRFRERVQAEPDQMDNYLTLARLFVRRAELGAPSGYSAADLVLEEALNRNPDFTPAQLLLAEVLHAQCLYQEGLAEAQQVLLSDPNSAEAMSLVADSHRALGRYAAARTAYERVPNRTPDLLARLAELEWVQGNTDDAYTLARDAALDALWMPQYRHEMAERLLLLGRLSFERNDWRGAENFLNAAVRVDPNADTLSQLGRLRLAQERYRDAARTLERSLEVMETPRALMLLADTYEALGEPDRADDALRRVPEAARAPMAPSEDRIRPCYYGDLVHYYADYAHNSEEALRMARRNLEYKLDAYAQDALAWALYRNNQADQAAEAIHEAMAPGIQDAGIYYHAGMILRALGYVEEGNNFLRKALRLNAGFSARGAREIRTVLGDRLP